MDFTGSHHGILKSIVTILKSYMVNIDTQLNRYSDFQNLDIDFLKGFSYSSSDRNLDFVDNLRRYFNRDNIDDYTIKFWIINKWGGISSFKDNHEKTVNSNRVKIDTFLKKIEDKTKLTKPLFEVISSLSKVASFSDSSRFFVYDSRVIYSLNWLFLKNDIKEIKFFPMPQGRNAKLSFFDLDTIIKLKRKNDYTELDVSNLYFDHTDAYYIYCNLIKELAQELIPNKPSYYLEMFLFTLVNKIHEEIREMIDISLSNK